jgi:hypothetical protein
VPYDEYAPAYRYGYTSVTKYPGRDYDDVEADLEQNWDRNREGASLDWARAKYATKDAWQRVRDRSSSRDRNRNP